MQLQSTLTNVFRRIRPGFAFDPTLSTSMLIRFMCTLITNWLRASKLLLYGFLPAGRCIGHSVRLRYTSHIELGRWTRLEENVLLSALGSGLISLGNNVRIGAYSRLIISTTLGQLGQFIHIGHNVGLGEFSYLGGAGGLTIGDDCIIGQYFSCHPENHHFKDKHVLIRQQGVHRQGIHIGKNCWIGSKVTVLDGVTIGDCCVIAAGAVVTKDIPSHSVAGGIPARILSTL